MIIALKLIYSLFLPTGMFFLALLAVACWSYRRDKTIGKVFLGLTVIYYILTTGLLASFIIHSLECRYTPPRQPVGDVIIMLSGGATRDTPNLDGQGHLSGYAASRLLTTVELYHKLGLPIIVSGGQVTESDGLEADIAGTSLLGMGIPADKIIIESTSRNTSENARNCAALIAHYGFRHPLLVTSAFHMERAVLQFAKVNITVVPVPTGYLVNREFYPDIGDFFPAGQNSDLLSLGLKEYLGIAAVRWY